MVVYGNSMQWFRFFDGNIPHGESKHRATRNNRQFALVEIVNRFSEYLNRQVAHPEVNFIMNYISTRVYKHSTSSISTVLAIEQGIELALSTLKQA